MLKRIINTIKYHLVKEIILVDSENIGYQIPEEIPKHVLIYLFISQPLPEEFLDKYKNNRYLKIIDISSLRKERVSKNIMDFCIVTQLTELIFLVSKKTRIVICSKDRGYDASIDYLKQKYSFYQIERYPGSVGCYYYDGNSDYYEIMEKIDDQLKNTILNHTNMDSLKAVLDKKQRRAFLIKEYVNQIGMVKTSIEFDVYQMVYEVYYSGTKLGLFIDKEEALNEYNKCVDKLHDIYDKYGTHKRFIRSQQLNIRQYIEEAYKQNLPLEDYLIHYLGSNQGKLVYGIYMS